ncbi:hypothetical protein AHAS_Ahas20G0225700 [Arachis hypogaea]
MSDEKKNRVDKLGFGTMKHISGLNVTHKLLKKLANSFDLYNSSLYTRYEKIKITSNKIRDVLDLNASGKNSFCNLFCQSNFGIF